MEFIKKLKGWLFVEGEYCHLYFGCVRNETMKDFVCCGCGKEIDMEESEGSMKAPFCRECFIERFSAYDEYLIWLEG